MMQLDGSPYGDVIASLVL